MDTTDTSKRLYASPQERKEVLDFIYTLICVLHIDIKNSYRTGNNNATRKKYIKILDGLINNLSILDCDIATDIMETRQSLEEGPHKSFLERLSLLVFDGGDYNPMDYDTMIKESKLHKQDLLYPVELALQIQSEQWIEMIDNNINHYYSITCYEIIRQAQEKIPQKLIQENINKLIEKVRKCYELEEKYHEVIKDIENIDAIKELVANKLSQKFEEVIKRLIREFFSDGSIITDNLEDKMKTEYNDDFAIFCEEVLKQTNTNVESIIISTEKQNQINQKIEEYRRSKETKLMAMDITIRESTTFQDIIKQNLKDPACFNTYSRQVKMNLDAIRYEEELKYIKSGRDLAKYRYQESKGFEGFARDYLSTNNHFTRIVFEILFIYFCILSVDQFTGYTTKIDESANTTRGSNIDKTTKIKKAFYKMFLYTFEINVRNRPKILSGLAISIVICIANIYLSLNVFDDTWINILSWILLFNWYIFLFYYMFLFTTSIKQL